MSHFTLDKKSWTYSEILQEARAVTTGYWLSDLANLSSLLYHRLPLISWSGFYLFDGDKSLRLGPFVGRPACTDILVGRGVCGEAFLKQKNLRVSDVHQFPGHIACDPDSRSELVIPWTFADQPLGVLDLDSTELGRFTEEDETQIAIALKNLTQALGLSVINRPWNFRQ